MYLTQPNPQITRAVYLVESLDLALRQHALEIDYVSLFFR